MSTTITATKAFYRHNNICFDESLSTDKNYGVPKFPIKEEGLIYIFMKYVSIDSCLK